MVHPERFYKHLSGKGIDFFTGVPDSLLKSLLIYFHQNINHSQHIITANEGLAIALAAGYNISTGKLPLVYMQNSGLGNAINPLTSLADQEVYSVPMLLLIGWRGRPGKQDEPQHIKMGKITSTILEVLGIPFFILSEDESKNFLLIDEAIALTVSQQKPVALLVPGEVFEESPTLSSNSTYPLSREFVLNELLHHFRDEVIVCSTGKASRELFELNQHLSEPLIKTFLTVGSMGLANHIALGIDMHSSQRMVMIDGDGSLLMHMGSMATIASLAKDDFVHILINNGCHESVGAQPTLGFDIDFCAIARACGYQRTYCIGKEQELISWLQTGYAAKEKQFVEIRVHSGSRSDLARPTKSPLERKDDLMKALKSK